MSVEIHKNCGGTVKLKHEAWRCTRCQKVCAVDETETVPEQPEPPEEPAS